MGVSDMDNAHRCGLTAAKSIGKHAPVGSVKPDEIFRDADKRVFRDVDCVGQRPAVGLKFGIIADE